jgi:hypothetical protein
MMASKNEEDKQLANELWYWYLTGNTSTASQRAMCA